MQDLQTFIDQLSKGRSLHISILDLNGILNTPITKVEFKNVIHSKQFCNIAKSTDKGYKTCLRCKMLANTKAIVEKKSFDGYCLYGLYEAGYPVIMNGEAAAIVYVGNAVIDINETGRRIKKTCERTQADGEKLCEELCNCERIEEKNELLQIAEIVSDYLRLLYINAPKQTQELHWTVSLLKRHADEAYCSELSLKELAATYRKNEKYLGRLFKKQIGMSFSEYVSNMRLKKAEELLLASELKIIDIALECGFNSVSYFNKLFQKKRGMSPRAYRAEYKRP